MKRLNVLLLALLLALSLCACGSQSPAAASQPGSGSLAPDTTQQDEAPDQSSEAPAEETEALEKWKPLADAYMEEEWGAWDYTYAWWNHGDPGVWRFFYMVDKSSDVLSQNFVLRVNVELNGRVTSGRTDFDTTPSDTVAPYNFRTWNLEGTWTYTGGDQDFTLHISEVDGDRFTMTYELYNASYNTSFTTDYISDAPVTVELVQYQEDSDESWYVSGTEFSIWVYPFGASLSSGGEGSGISIDGHWLTKTA